MLYASAATTTAAVATTTAALPTTAVSSGPDGGDNSRSRGGETGSGSQTNSGKTN